jgi:hypothetical protein
MANIPDLINGAFELTGGIVCWLNVLRLLKDRRIEGVDWRVSGFFSAWGIWNLFYYPSLHQWASFAGGLLLVVANTTWVVLALRMMKEQTRAEHMKHKAWDPNCPICREALEDFNRHLFGDIKLTALPGRDCDCDICTDPNYPRL